MTWAARSDLVLLGVFFVIRIPQLGHLMVFGFLYFTALATWRMGQREQVCA